MNKEEILNTIMSSAGFKSQNDIRQNPVAYRNCELEAMQTYSDKENSELKAEILLLAKESTNKITELIEQKNELIKRVNELEEENKAVKGIRINIHTKNDLPGFGAYLKPVDGASYFDDSTIILNVAACIHAAIDEDVEAMDKNICLISSFNCPTSIGLRYLQTKIK